MQLTIQNVTKTYGSTYALRDFSVTLGEGIHGLLGANGAGKSTLINLITDNVSRTEGKILFDGMDILTLGKKFRDCVGYMPQQQGAYEQLSARAFLLYMASLKGIPKKDARRQADELLTVVNLQEQSHKKIGTFSGGMRQRVLLAQALLGDPKVLILDEPTAGLDPKERIRIRNFISELSQNRIILLATHIVGDIECIADDVLLMQKGRLLRHDTPTQLMQEVQMFERACARSELHALQQTYKNSTVTQRREGLVLRIAAHEKPQGFVPANDTATMEDVYLFYLEE